MSEKKEYLGDGVYIDIENGMFKLTTEDGIRATNTVFLESEVYKALARYAGRLDARFREVEDEEVLADLDRLKKIEADIEAAAGELMVPVPEPGTDAAKVMIANRLLKAEVERLTADLKLVEKVRDEEKDEKSPCRKCGGGGKAERFDVDSGPCEFCHGTGYILTAEFFKAPKRGGYDALETQRREDSKADDPDEFIDDELVIERDGEKFGTPEWLKAMGKARKGPVPLKAEETGKREADTTRCQTCLGSGTDAPAKDRRCLACNGSGRAPGTTGRQTCDPCKGTGVAPDSPPSFAEYPREIVCLNCRGVIGYATPDAGPRGRLEDSFVRPDGSRPERFDPICQKCGGAAGGPFWLRDRETGEWVGDPPPHNQLPCAECDGTGTRLLDSNVQPCPKCNGRGLERPDDPDGPNPPQPCPTCNGRGRRPAQADRDAMIPPCPTCNGTGKIPKEDPNDATTDEP